MMAVFEKGERLRHIGHLDIQRAMQRALRRSGLPVAYSNGFNPHILLTFASALSTGAAGTNELMETTLTEDVTPEAFLRAMNDALPPDMQLRSCRPLEDRHPALMAMVTAAEYDIRMLNGDIAPKLAAALPQLLAQQHVMAIRKTKSGEKEVDCRPQILSVTAEGDVLHATLVLTERESCKPDMLLKALASLAGTEVPRVMVVRRRLLGQAPDGTRVPLEEL